MALIVLRAGWIIRGNKRGWVESQRAGRRPRCRSRSRDGRITRRDVLGSQGVDKNSWSVGTSNGTILRHVLSWSRGGDRSGNKSRQRHRRRHRRRRNTRRGTRSRGDSSRVGGVKIELRGVGLGTRKRGGSFVRRSCRVGLGRWEVKEYN